MLKIWMISSVTKFVSYSLTNLSLKTLKFSWYQSLISSSGCWTVLEFEFIIPWNTFDKSLKLN